MVLGRILLDCFVISYAVSICVLFVDVVEPRRAVNRTALSLLFAAFCFLTAFFLRELWSSGLTPVYSLFDVSLLTAWLILLVALVVNAFFRMGIVLFLANAVGFLIVLFASFVYSDRTVYTAPRGDLLVVHIILAIISYAALAFSSIFSGLYLLQHHLLKVKLWNRWFLLLPSLERLDAYATRGVIVGFPLLMVSIALGAVWGRITHAHAFWSDPKVWLTGVIGMVYGLYLALRIRSGFASSKLAWLNVICFAVLILNFSVVSHFSASHLPHGHNVDAFRSGVSPGDITSVAERLS